MICAECAAVHPAPSRAGGRVSAPLLPAALVTWGVTQHVSKPERWR